MSDLVASLEGTQQELEEMAAYLKQFREGNRSIALAITKLDEARLWLGEAIILERNPE